MKFSVKDFFSKCDQICCFLQIWSHLLKKSLMENFIFCTMYMLNVFKTYRFLKREFTISSVEIQSKQK